MPRATPSPNDAKSRVIRQAARDLFLAQGFAATSTDQIAAAAGVSKATIYSRYRQKEELLTAVLGDMLDALEFPDMNGAVHSATELRGVLAQVASRAVAVLTRPDYLRLVRTLIAEMPSQPELGERFAEAVPLRILGRLGGLFQSAREAGLIHAADPELTARAFIGPLLTFVLLDGLLAREPRVPDEAQLAGLLELFCRNLFMEEANGAS